MNQREFYERIYNYKHGIKEDNDTIQHSAKGDEWDSHKYKDKIYLGSGRYRYIYDDGTESTGYKPLDVNDEVRVKQRAQQTANTAAGIGNFLKNNTQSTTNPNYSTSNANAASQEAKAKASGTPSSKPVPYKAIADQQAAGKVEEAERKAASTVSDASQIGSFLKDNVGTQSPSNPEFSQARKEAYAAEGYDKAPKSAPIPYAKLDAQAKEGEKMEALYGGTGGQVKPNTGTLGSGVASDSAKQTTAPNFAQGLRTNLAQTTLSDSTNIGNKQQPNFNPAVGQSRSNEAIDIGNFLTQNVQSPTNPAVPAPQGTPYSELQSQSVNSTRDTQARKIVDDYMWQLEEDVYDPLKRAGYSDEFIWGIIDSMESSLAGEAISRQIAYLPNDTQVSFLPGAEEGLQVYLDQVLPVLKNVAANVAPAQNKSDESIERFNNEILKNSNINKPDSIYNYVIQEGYDPNHIPASAVTKMFGLDTNEGEEYYMDTLGFLHKRIN